MQCLPGILGDVAGRAWTAFRTRIDPGDPLEKDIYDLSPEELKDVPTLPGSLDDSLKALEADHDFLLKGDVFSPQLIERWISYKRDRGDYSTEDASTSIGVRDVLRHLTSLFDRDVVVPLRFLCVLCVSVVKVVTNGTEYWRSARVSY